MICSIVSPSISPSYTLGDIDGLETITFAVGDLKKKHGNSGWASIGLQPDITGMKDVPAAWWVLVGLGDISGDQPLQDVYTQDREELEQVLIEACAQLSWARVSKRYS